MSSKKLYESLWENFTKKTPVLTEMKDEYMRLISGATLAAQQNPQVLPFRSMFGDKLRVVIPYPRKNVGSIIQLLTIFKYYHPLSNWTESFAVMLVDQKVKVKKQALAIAGGGTYEEEKTVKQFVINHNYKDQQNNRRTRELTVIGALQKIKSFASFTLKNFEKGNFKHKNEYGEEKEYSEYEKNNKEQTCKDVLEKVDQLIAWWNKNQSKFVDDPQIFNMALQGFHESDSNAWVRFDPNSEAGGMTDEYSIILSRAPVDVLRMSDHQGIESCHSQPSHYGSGGYFYCAIAEAQNQGGIAYVVKTEDLEDVNLDKPEIFEDDERKVSGIEPIARVRIRTVRNKKTNEIYAVPETRVYGEYLPDLPEVVREFVIDKQEFLYIDTDEQGNKQFKFAQSMSDLETLGGSYQDHPKIGGNLVLVINKLLKQAGVEPTEQQRDLIKNIEAAYTLRYGGDESQYRRYSGDDDDEDEDQMREAAEDTFSNDLRRAKRNTEVFDFSACEFNYEWGDGPSIQFHASVTFNFKTKFLIKDYFDERGDINLGLLKSDITYYLIHAENLDYNFTYPDADINESEIYIGRIDNGDTITYQLVYYEDGLSNQQFESRIDDLINFERGVGGIDGLSSNFISVLVGDGVLIPDAADQTTQYRLIYNNFVKWANSQANHIDEERAQEFSVLPSKEMRSTHQDTSKTGWLLDKIPFSYFAQEERSWDRSRLAETIKQALEHSLTQHFGNAIYEKSDMDPRERERTQGRLFQDIAPDTGVKEIYKKLSKMGAFRVEVKLVPLTDDMITINNWEGTSGNNTASQVGIFIKPIFTINLKLQEPSSVLALIDAMYMVDEDPNIVMDIMYDSYKRYVKNASDHSSFARQAGSTKLTESRKRVIKERLKNWYRANKGSK